MVWCRSTISVTRSSNVGALSAGAAALSFVLLGSLITSAAGIAGRGMLEELRLFACLAFSRGNLGRGRGVELALTCFAVDCSVTGQVKRIEVQIELVCFNVFQFFAFLSSLFAIFRATANTVK